MTNLQKIQQETEEMAKFRDKHFVKNAYGYWCVHTEGEELLKDIEILIHYRESIAYKAGRQSVIDEWNHEHRKFIEGFAHPKDCPICKTLIDEELKEKTDR